MKNLILPIICLGLLLTATGCSNTRQEKNNAPDLSEVGLTEYMETVKLPKNLSLAFDTTLNPSAIKEGESVKVYRAEWLKLDPQKTADTILRYDIQETGMYAEGPYFIAGNEEWAEYLNLHDGVLKGGFNYSLVRKGSDIGKLESVVNLHPGFPENRAKTLNPDYDTKKDLAFMEYEKAVAETEKLLTECGFPAMEVQEVYSLDAETMKAKYLQRNKTDTENPEDRYEWSEADECYLIHFRQTCDGIPLINILWEEGTRQDWNATETQIYAIYSRDGVTDISADSLYTIKEEEEGTPIRSAEALQTLVDDYSKGILTSETKVLSMELNYVGTYRGDQIELVPAWVLTVSRLKTVEDKPWEEYSCFVVNALTGKRIRTAVDNR